MLIHRATRCINLLPSERLWPGPRVGPGSANSGPAVPRGSHGALVRQGLLNSGCSLAQAIQLSKEGWPLLRSQTNGLKLQSIDCLTLFTKVSFKISTVSSLQISTVKMLLHSRTGPIQVQQSVTVAGQVTLYSWHHWHLLLYLQIFIIIILLE